MHVSDISSSISTWNQYKNVVNWPMMSNVIQRYACISNRKTHSLYYMS